MGEPASICHIETHFRSNPSTFKGCKTPNSPSELQILQDAIKKIDQKQTTPKIYSKKQAIVDKLSINLI
jgi:hypothetical protein